MTDYTIQPTNSHPRHVPEFPSAAKAITKSDADTYSKGVFVYVGTAGDVTIVPFAGDQRVASTPITFKGIPAGGMVPCMAYQVLAATTAQDLVAVR